MQQKVLVLDAESAAGLEAVQSLGRKGCVVHTASLLIEYTRTRSRFIHEQFDWTRSKDGGVTELIECFCAENYDLIVPPTEVALLAILNPRIPAELYRRAVLPPPAQVKTALDKQQVWTLAQSLGVRVPSSKMVSAVSQPPTTFPVVLKPVFSKTNTAGAIDEYGVTVARNYEQWRAAMQFTYRNVSVQQQEYVSGLGLGVEMLFENGQPRWSFLHQRVHELPLTGGGSSYRVSVPPARGLVESATALLTAFQWHGVAMVEFKVAPSGETWLVEINPRLWGSLALALDCGVDFPYGLLCLATGRQLSQQPIYRSGYYTRNLSRDIEWFKRNLCADHTDPLLLTRPVLKTSLEFLRPLIGQESWDFFSWSDLGIILGELKALVRQNLRGVLSGLKSKLIRTYLTRIQQPRLLRSLRGRKADSILVLCHGNICRSPLAGQMLGRAFPNVATVSAGFHPKVGRSSPRFVQDEASRLGYDLAEHRSQCVDEGLINSASLILIMDMRNYRLLRAKFPRALSKTLFLGMLLPEPQLEILDPYDDPPSMPDVSLGMKTAIESLRKYVG